ncbi:MAG: DUF4352 domain-containing protein [Ruminococcus sp.]|nr:DUF4352 domain-containing protein [Ruminococcus sp.]
MNKSRISAFIIALAFSTVCAFSCAENNASEPDTRTSVIDTAKSTEPVQNKYSGNSHKTDSAFAQEAEVNNTIFKLNDVVRVPAPNISGSDFIYLNVTIKNKVDLEYEISSMNNFFIALPDETELAPDVRAKLYALQNYPVCIDDNITIPANGEFSGFLAGGFLVPSDTDSLTVGFFPTLNNAKDSSNVILTPVKGGNISDSDLVMR